MTPTDRERFVISEAVKSAARCSDTIFCSEKGEREYGRGEMVMLAKSIADESVSSNQLENLLALVELALECKNG